MMPTASGDGWIKASASSANGSCVELRPLPGGHVAMRDSKNPGGTALVFSPQEIAAFLVGAKAGEFDGLAAQPEADLGNNPNGQTVDSETAQCGHRAHREFTDGQDIRCNEEPGHYWHRNGHRRWTS